MLRNRLRKRIDWAISFFLLIFFLHIFLACLKRGGFGVFIRLQSRGV